MKNIIIIIVIALSYSSVSFAEWQRQSFPSKYFKKVYFVNESTGFAVGNSGIIFRTTNSGTNWMQQNSTTTRNLLSIGFTGDGRGIIGGEGIILTTHDFGQSWEINRQWSGINPCSDTVRRVLIDVIDNSLYLTVNSSFSCGYYSLGEFFSVTNQFNLVKLYEKPYLILRTISHESGYISMAATVTNFGPTYHLSDLDQNWASTNERNYELCNSGFFLLEPQLVFRGFHAFTPNSASQTLFNPQSSAQISEWYYFQQTPYWTTERGYEYIPNDMALANSQEIYIAGWNNYDRDNRHSKSCIKRFNISQDRIYTEYEEENLSLYSVCVTASNVFVVGDGVILCRDNLTGEGNNSQVAKDFSLSQNYPNPFNPATTINYSIPKAGNVSLVVYDITGKVVVELVNGIKGIGEHQAVFNANSLSSGMYFYTLTASGKSSTKKMMLIK